MSELLNILSEERLAELFRRSKLTILSENEETLDRSYLESMIAAEIDVVQSRHLVPATHAFDVEQRLRADEVEETGNCFTTYEKMAPAIRGNFFCVPVVI